MNYIDPLTPEPDNSWAQKFTTQQLINSHNHLISVGMANSRAVRLMRDEINLRARIARKLRARGVALDNFDPNELRDWHGRWTDGNAPGTYATNPDQIPGNHPGILTRIADVLQKFAEKITDTLKNHRGSLEDLDVLGKLSQAVIGDLAAKIGGYPEFSGNLAAWVKGDPLPIDAALRDSALEQQLRGETPVATVLGRVSEGLAPIVPTIPLFEGLPPAAKSIVNILFTAQMIVEAPKIALDLYKEFQKPPDQRDPDKIDSLVADAVQIVGFSLLELLGPKETSKTPESPEKKEAEGQAGEAKSPNEEPPIVVQPYGGPGGGHHTPAKIAFEGDPNYNRNKPPAIPNAELDRLGVNHDVVSGAQQVLYRAYAKTGQTLTWEVMEKIETEALMRGGAKSETIANAAVKQAISALKAGGITKPTRIPWGN